MNRTLFWILRKYHHLRMDLRRAWRSPRVLWAKWVLRNAPTPWITSDLTARQERAIMVMFDEMSAWGDDIIAGALPAPAPKKSRSQGSVSD